MNEKNKYISMNEVNPLASASSTLSLPLLALNCDIKHDFGKRTFDILFSLVILITTLPLFLLIALAIRLSSKGKIVYAHERISRGGRPFKCYKFRTMYPDADQRLQEILEKCPERLKEWEAHHKLKNDPRITPIGSFLRKTSLDEFPQFWNVLIGDMSIVGPRPVVRAEVIKHLGPNAASILRVRPGITGPWQISGRSDISYPQRIKMDLDYVSSRTFWKDMIIVLKTVPCMIFSKGAY